MDDTNGADDIFVHDRVTGITERASVASDGAQGSGDCGDVSISSDGRYVAFSSMAPNLVPGDTNGAGDIFVHDRATGITERASVASDGTQVSAQSHVSCPSISGNGRYVMFNSYDSNLVPNDTNETCDIFVHDRVSNQTERVNVATDGAQANDYTYSYWEGISSDGRYVAFVSVASNLVPDDTNGVADVFIRDCVTGITERLSVASEGTQGSDQSGGPSVSDDGRFVAFGSGAPNLVLGDTNDTWDVFVHDRFTGDPGTTDEDPVLQPTGDAADASKQTALPILVYIAGLYSNTGVGPGVNYSDSDYGRPWDYLFRSARMSSLAVAAHYIVPTTEYATDPIVIDSRGDLDTNVRRLSRWLSSHSAEFEGHPIVLVGHSYGGVIARGLVSTPSALLGSGVADQIAGIIQFGSPNVGSPAATLGDLAGSEALHIKDCEAVNDLTPLAMSRWNMNHSNPGYPIYRIRGSYLPDALSTSGRLSLWERLFLSGTWAQFDFDVTDGAVWGESIEGALSSEYHTGYSFTVPLLKHSSTVPGHDFDEIVPQSDEAATLLAFDTMIWRLRSGFASVHSGLAASAMSAITPAEIEGEVLQTSRLLPERDVEVVSNTLTDIDVVLDAGTIVYLTSEDAAPTCSVAGPASPTVLQASNIAEGVYSTVLEIDPSMTGTHTLSVGLDGSATGTVRLSGVSSAGATLSVETSPSEPSEGDPVSVQASFLDADAAPIMGASVTLHATCDETSLDVTMADDGVAPDLVAGDGVYTATFVPSVHGTWVVRTDAYSSSAERSASTVLQIGSASWATISGAAEETTTAGGGGP
ncbi:MAG TPA: hypothetical protein DCP20_09155, partial [Coriobacteriia bacterium]|nr:hypothetical protein [Coriobacteriia bacterium]